MPRLDIIGVGGVGKTTFVQNLKSFRKSPKWMDEREALNITIRRALKSASYSVYLKSILYALSAFRINLPNSIATQFMMKMGGNCYIEFLENHPLFLQAIGKCIERSGTNNIQKLNFIHHFVHVLQKLSFIERFTEKDDWVIWDESLTHKMFAVIPWTEDSIDLVELYCESVPLPDGIIYLRDSPDRIAKKILKRSCSGRTVVAHANLDTDGLTNLNIITNVLAEESLNIMAYRGVNILELNAKDENEVNITKAQEFIKTLIAPT